VDRQSVRPKGAVRKSTDLIGFSCDDVRTSFHMESMMTKRPLLLSAVACAFSLSAGLALAEDQAHDQIRDQARDETKAKTQEQEKIYGSQLMTQKERAEYRAQMRTAKTAEGREQIRIQHHERMKERAKARNVALPDEPLVHDSGIVSGGAMRPAGGMEGSEMTPGGGGMEGGGMGSGGGGMDSGGAR
jgi:hypothetical protein